MCGRSQGNIYNVERGLRKCSREERLSVLPFYIGWLKKQQILSDPGKRGSAPGGVWKVEGAATESLLCAERPGRPLRSCGGKGAPGGQRSVNVTLERQHGREESWRPL